MKLKQRIWLSKRKKIKNKLDDEDRKEFYMQGKPYKDKFNGQRLSKV